MTSLSPSIVQRLQASGMKLTAIDTDAAEAFEHADFIEATLDKWIADYKAKKPHCFIGDEQVDLEHSAFVENNITARMRLVSASARASSAARATTSRHVARRATSSAAHQRSPLAGRGSTIRTVTMAGRGPQSGR
jgi:hypothetical protein